MGLSMLVRSSSALGVECPIGYRFYACAASNFIGCCSTDPCGLPNACPLENTPASSTSSSVPIATAEPTTQSFPTNTPSFTNLSTSRVVTVVIPTTHLSSPTTTTTATVSTIFSLPPSSSPSSSSVASNSSSPKQFNPVGLIVGLTVGFTVLALMLVLVIHLLWRRRQTRDPCDEDPILPRMGHRATAFYLPQKQPFNSPIMTSPNTDKPVPPAPTSARPWRQSFAEAGLSDQQAVRDSRPSPRHIPIVTAAPAPTDTDEAAPAPTVWRRRSDAPREPAPAAVRAQGRAQRPMSRSSSPVDSIFDVPQRRTTAEMDASWALFRGDPAAFYGLSAPPRSRDGSRPGSNSNQGG
ncbi:hypothetical protein KVR01_005345 [Diaporthe batatas]|uniref:uncharacterized protein n=1 Tax=Diaporthe batatas TaxID=748121 RepID=UPI001D04B22E|nr:uncharacterized protein KVR01_005345 [Diaporthe batatas]KAG8165070.1 hypothetical protein KVR01_005345 [Diaporthe batatas]